MADAGVRVALLARAGRARDQLHRALGEAGAQIVVEGDPAELSPAQVAKQSPTVFLVSLEPAIEASLDRFDELLSAPGVEVMFDDAEITAKLDGWDLNRWARHLASKLLGTEGLPPAPNDAPAWTQDHISLDPGAPPTPAELMDGARLEDYTTDASELADSVPVSPSLLAESPDLGLDMDVDLTALDEAFEQRSPAVAHREADSEAEGEALYVDIDLDESVSFSSFAPEDHAHGDLDADVAELAAQLEAFEKNDKRFEHVTTQAPGSGRLSLAPDITAVIDLAERGAAEESVAESRTAAPAARAAVSFDFSNLALAPMDGVDEPVASAQPVAAASARPDELALVADSDNAPAGTAVAGAVVILAGLGGPDAVRQLLSSLPENLPVPVLLYQHLEVGKHERLVEQLAKISKLPVMLAVDGGVPQPGKVTLLPAGLTAVARGASLAFAPGALSELITALPPLDSTIIVLSGAEVQLVPLIISVRDAGGLVLAQDPEVCFDAAAAEAMQGQGAAVYPALGLARQVAARWSP